MFSFRTTPLSLQEDTVLRKGRLAVLCNQAAWHPDTGEYLFESLARRGNLVKIFTPEHSLYGKLVEGVGTVEVGKSIEPSELEGIDALVIELQDVGSRYSNYTSLIFNLFKYLKVTDSPISVFILDRLNPSGRQIEGTLGIIGLPHRHGLTLGEVANMFYTELNAKFPLHIISAAAEQVNKELMAWTIPPFSDFAGLFTSNFYSGQCLWKGTNVSYGHGTNRPFEQFGAPFMESLFDFNGRNGFNGWNDPSNPISNPSINIRWTRFVPAYGIYQDEVCFGFQLMFIPGVPYHALNHALQLLRFVHDNCPEFKCEELNRYLEDATLLSYVEGSLDWESTKEYIKGEEQKWLRKSKKFALYGDEPLRVK
ncbi:MAG: DUF1343 domain-containing protein [Bacteroidales bacterium]|nr:DUF1343 domain-containing protein [Candidatus Cacconaster merdequi]